MRRFRKARKVELRSKEVDVDQIVKYRQIAQLLRACLVPILLFIFFMFRLENIGLRIIYILVTYVIILLLFSYGEVVIYQQCLKRSGQWRRALWYGSAGIERCCPHHHPSEGLCKTERSG